MKFIQYLIIFILLGCQSQKLDEQLEVTMHIEQLEMGGVAVKIKNNLDKPITVTVPFMSAYEYAFDIHIEKELNSGVFEDPPKLGALMDRSNDEVIEVQNNENVYYFIITEIFKEHVLNKRIKISMTYFTENTHQTIYSNIITIE